MMLEYPMLGSLILVKSNSEFNNYFDLSRVSSNTIGIRVSLVNNMYFWTVG